MPDSVTFVSLIADLRRLPLGGEDLHALRYIERIELAAVGLVYRMRKQSPKLFSWIDDNVFPEDWRVNERRLWAWDAIRRAVAMGTPDGRLPDHMSIGGAVGKTEIAGVGGNIRKGLFSRPASNWRVRLHDDCEVFAVLADYVGEYDNPPEASIELTGKQETVKGGEVSAQSDGAKQETQRRKPSEWSAHALLLLSQDPARTDADIAHEVNISRSQLSRNVTYRCGAKIARSQPPPPRGFKGSEGSIEAADSEYRPDRHIEE